MKKKLRCIQFKKFDILNWSFYLRWFLPSCSDEKRKLNVVNICWLFTHSCIILYFEKLQKVFSRCSICYMAKTFSFNVTKMLKRFVKNELRWNHQSVKRGNRLRMAEDSEFLLVLTQEHHLQNALYIIYEIHFEFSNTLSILSNRNRYHLSCLFYR